MNAHRLWWIGGALVAVAIAALAYLFGVAPQLSQAADARNQQVSAQGQLQQTELQLAALKKQYESLPELTAQLAALQKSVPGTAKVSDFVRQLGAQASAAQVSITTVNVSEPTAYAPTVPAGGATAAAGSSTATPTPAPTASASPTASPTAVATAAPSAPPLVTDPAITSANFVLLPVTLTVTGSHDSLLAFTSAVQNEGPRLFLVNKIDLTASSASGATAGPAETETLSGLIYVLVGNS